MFTVQLQVLIDDSARLQQAYPGGNAEHIASQQAMVVDNWEILQQKSAQRKSDLQATMDLYWFLNAVSDVYSSHLNLKADKYVVFSRSMKTDLYDAVNQGNWKHFVEKLCVLIIVIVVNFSSVTCVVGAPLYPLVHLLPHLFLLFYFSLSFIGFTYFLLLSIPSLSTRIVPLRFQAGGRRRRPNLVLVYFMLSVFLSLDVFWCFVVFHLVLCVFLQCFDTVIYLTHKNPSPI